MEFLDSLPAARKICIQAVPWLNDTRGPKIVAAVATLTTLAIVAVLLRLQARRISKLRFGWDDWLIVFALMFSFGLSVTVFMSM